MPTMQPKKSSQSLQQHHYVRTLTSSIFGSLAVALIMVSIVALWLGSTLTNTTHFVNTVAPLVEKTDVQNFVVTKASDEILDDEDLDIQDLAIKVLGADKVAGKTPEQLKAEVTPEVRASLTSVVSSPAFATLWKTNNEAVHAQLVKQLDTDTQPLVLDFHPLIVGVLDELSTTKLAFLKTDLDLKPDSGVVTVESKKFENLHKGYDGLKKGMVAIVLLALLLTGLCVWASVHHLKTLRRIAVATGIYSALLAGALSAGSLINTSGADAEQQKFIFAMINGITHDLRISLIVIAVVCFAGAIGSKIYAAKHQRR